MGIIISTICHRLKIDAKQSIFCFIMPQHKLVDISKGVGEVYEQYKEEDGILYVKFTDHPGFWHIISFILWSLKVITSIEFVALRMPKFDSDQEY